MIGALSLYEGWGRVSTVLFFTAAAIALSRVGGAVAGAQIPKANIGFDYMTLTLACTSVMLETRGL
jgi:hypothetical protein